MDRDAKRLAVAVGAGLFMSLIVWLFTAESSPAYRWLLEQHQAGQALLLLNLPALFLSRVMSGTPPTPWLVYLACFVQWFIIGLAVSSFIWRKPNDAQQGVPADGPRAARSARR